MKRIAVNTFALSLIMIILSHWALAQSNDNHSTIGIKGGVNMSNLYDDDGEDENMIAGFHGGVFVKAALSDHLAFQPELLFTTKGAKINYENAFVEGEARFRFSYVELPLLVKLNLTRNINIHAGPYLSALLNAKVNNESSADFFDFEEELDKDDFEKLDYGLVAGLGVDLNKVSIGLRYDYGLQKVGKEKSFLGQDYRLPDATNACLQFYVAISLL